MIRLSDLLRKQVVTESGEELGHVFDVRVARNPRSSTKKDDQDWQVAGLVIGERGFRERFGFTHAGPAGPRDARDAVAWGAVMRIEDDRVVVREGTTLS